MTPYDYSAFREALGRSSGFQSYQYRSLEYLIGNRNPAMIEVHRHDPQVYARLEALLRRPSLYDECLRLLARRGYALPPERVERDWSEPYVAHEAVAAAWLDVYRHPRERWDLYELAEKLVDLDHRFQLWRYAHLKTVERIIGYKRGTGGTSGVAYLAKALELRFFPELWTVRTSM
jgi:tryptophan 2,3-dioxygenase